LPEPPVSKAAELQNNAEVEKVLSDGNAKEHLAAAKACDCSTPCRECKCFSAGIPVRLSFWQRFKLWFAELVAPLCSYREGGVNYRPPVKQE